MKLNSIILILLAYYLVYFTSLLLRQEKAEVIFYDVGQGDSILITTERGKRVLIDGGGNYEIDSYLNKSSPFFDCKIDIVFLTHPHADHLAGLTRLLQRCHIYDLRFNDITYKSFYFEKFKEQSRKNYPRSVLIGENILVNKLELKILWPSQKILQSILDNVNNTSVVMLAQYKTFDILLLGDAETEALSAIDIEELRNSIRGELEIVKISHHGSRTGISKRLYSDLKPQYCVISVGKDNKFGHPHSEALEFYNNLGCKVLRTDELGSIRFELE